MSRRTLAFLTMAPLAVALSYVAVQAAAQHAAPPAAKALPEGNGKQMVEAMCIGCHSTDYVFNAGGYSKEHWAQLVNSMLPLEGRPQLEQITNYLATNFPPTEARKPKLVEGDVKLSFTSWKVPTLGQMPRDPVEAPDGSIWWVAQWPSGNLVGRLDPKTGQMKEYPLPPNTLPHSVTPDANGIMWVSGNGNGTIVRVDPKDGAMKVYKMPDAAAKDPHTMVFDKNGIMWFTVQLSNRVGRFDTKTGAIKVVEVPRANSRPYGIKIASDGAPWFNCRNGNCVFRIDPATMALKEYKLPHTETWSRRLALDSQDNVWYVDTVRGSVGRLNPKTGDIKEWESPSGPKSEPYGLEIINDVVWYNESGKRPDALVRFDPKTEKFQSWAIPSKQGFYGGIARHIRQTRDGNLLVHQGSSNNITLVTIQKQTAAAR